MAGHVFLWLFVLACLMHTFFYAVSNWHVAVREGASVVRINTKDGKSESFEFGPEQWEFNPKYDIAVILLMNIDPNKHDVVLSLSQKDS